jgi:hypothetical protein
MRRKMLSETVADVKDVGRADHIEVLLKPIAVKKIIFDNGEVTAIQALTPSFLGLILAWPAICI